MAELPPALTVVLLLTGVAIIGGLIYRRWADWTALFAWLLPALWVCHLMLSRGAAVMEGQWSDPLFFLEVGAAYSAGAFIAAMVKMSHKLPARLPSCLSDDRQLTQHRVSDNVGAVNPYFERTAPCTRKSAPFRSS